MLLVRLFRPDHVCDVGKVLENTLVNNGQQHGGLVEAQNTKSTHEAGHLRVIERATGIKTDL